MALVKAICAHCVEEGTPVIANFPWATWNRQWSEGHALCFGGRDDTHTLFETVAVNGPVPECCPYAAEHAVSQAIERT